MSDHNKTRRISTSADVDGSLIIEWGYLRKSKKNERYDLEAVLHRYCLVIEQLVLFRKDADVDRKRSEWKYIQIDLRFCGSRRIQQ